MWNNDKDGKPNRRQATPEIIDDEIIHAFIDDMLPPRQRLEVDEYLAGYPEEARRVADIQDQNRVFHVLFDGSLNQPLPKRLQDLEDDIYRKMGRRSRRRKVVRSLAKLSYAGVLIIAGLAVGWFMPLQSMAPGMLTALMPADKSVGEHARLTKVLTGDMMAQPAPASVEQQKQPTWARPPNLDELGFRLLGTRIIKSGSAMETAQLIYETEQGDQVILYLAKTTMDAAKQVALTHEGAVSILVWKDNGRSYTMISEAGRDRMIALGKSISKTLTPFSE